MSKENAIRFIEMKERNENIKSAFNSIMSKYEGKSLSEAEWGNVIQKEVIPLAESSGYDFTLDDIKELQTSSLKLSDDEMSEVAGGRGQFTETLDPYSEYFGRVVITYSNSCDYAPDDATFRARYYETTNSCPDYAFIGCGVRDHTCICCTHYQCKVTH
jgi:hypothetical protein